MSTLEWGPLQESDLPGLGSLARACLRKDGGLPQLATEAMLRHYFLTGVSIGGRDETGELVAVASVFWDSQGRRTATGMVHPSARLQGHGDSLVAWCRDHSPGVNLKVVAESMSPEAEALFARNGLRRTFAETVMCHSLGHIPRIALPDGLRTHPFGEDTALAFHTAYRLAFAERPGFPDTPAEKWLGWVRDDPGFRPEQSRVALAADGSPAGFVILVDAWIDQVGVVPQWRGRRLGAHLVARSLRALKNAGADSVWLNVNVDNPARILYERLGFEVRGTRARYE
ncbi:MAG TPA: GNAT family N-acetyltransferase [Candidatus Lustribacter sp.]|nr:GNAT family N-acetyltransferase [Candidatus Lustribacter sp.]